MGNILPTRFSSNAENRGSSANSDNPPEGVKKINDSLYELYSPDGEVELDIVFFHGLQIRDYKDAYWKTWSSDGNTIWPRTLLSSAFPQARILAVSYDSCVRKSERGGRVDLHRIGEYLVHDVIESVGACLGQKKRPVILVGHSLGGIAIKQFIMVAHNYLEQNTKPMAGNFVYNLLAIFYYATPHNGSRLAGVLRKLPGNSDVARFLTALNNGAAPLNGEFRILRNGRHIRAGSICETRPTKLKAWGANYIVVEEASARFDTDDFYIAAEDHISICKPKDETSVSFLCLKEFIMANTSEIGQKLTVK